MPRPANSNVLSDAAQYEALRTIHPSLPIIGIPGDVLYLLLPDGRQMCKPLENYGVDIWGHGTTGEFDLLVVNLPVQRAKITAAAAAQKPWTVPAQQLNEWTKEELSPVTADTITEDQITRILKWHDKANRT